MGMSLLRMLACREGSATLWEIDDPSVFTDEGTEIGPEFDTHPVDFGPASGYGRLRQVVQWFSLFGDALVTITPIADGSLLTEQAYQQALAVADGTEQRIEAPFAAPGARFGARVAISGAGALVEVGEADLTYVQRRSLTKGGG